MLWLTHFLAAFGGGLVVYLTMTRWKVRPVTNETRQRIKGGVFALGLSLFLVGAGIQAKLAQDAAEDFRHQQTCLNGFAADLVDTLSARVAANARLDRAQAAKDAAVDRVVETVALGSRIPPEATQAEFKEALEDFVTAKAALTKVKTQVAVELAKNPYPKTETPEAVCVR